MRISTVGHELRIGAAAVLLTGCGGSQPPIGAPGAMLQSHAIATHAPRGGSWMLPEAKSEDLLYVSEVGTVTVYSYPQGKLEGKLRGFFDATGECVDAKGDVYIADNGYGKVYCAATFLRRWGAEL
jgi:hypothetical protein